MPKILHYASDDYNDPEGGIDTSRETFPKVSVGHIRHVGYIIRTFPIPTTYIPIHTLSANTDDIHPDTHPVGDTIFTVDIIPPKKKSRLRMTTQQNSTTNYIYL